MNEDNSTINEHQALLTQANEAQVSLPELQASLRSANEALEASTKLIYRSYLGQLKDYPVLPLGDDASLDTQQTVRIFRLQRLVAENRRSILESLTAIYTALGAASYAAFVLIQSDGHRADVYLGCRASSRGHGDTGGTLLKASFDGHFPGSDLEPCNDKQVQELLAAIANRSPSSAVTAVTGVPSLSTDEREHFSQGLERFLDASSGQRYAALILAQPVSPLQLHEIQMGFESAATQIAPLQKLQLSYGEQDSRSVGLSLTAGVSTTLGRSLSLTEGTAVTDTTSTSTSSSKSVTKDFSNVLNMVNAIPEFGPAISGAARSFLGGSSTEGKTDTKANSRSVAENKGQTIGTNEGQTKNKSQTGSENLTSGSSRQMSVELPNKGIEQLLKKIDHHLERLDEARSYGAWHAAAYFMGETTAATQSLSSLFLGLMRGGDSNVEDFALTTWGQQQHEQRDGVLQWLKNLSHPRLKSDFGTMIDIPQVTPAALLSSRELALQLGLPHRSVVSTTVMEVPSFGRSVHLLDLDMPKGSEQRRQLKLGVLRHLWSDGGVPLHLDLDKLCYHTLITGTTGVGKTTAVMTLLAQAHQMGVPFLAIEPAKGEYRRLLGLSRSDRAVSWRVAGRSSAEALRINPMIFPEGIELTDHIDRLCTVFNAAFPMYAAMPQILEEAVFGAYEELGWDTLTSRCVGGVRRFPTLRRVVELIPVVVKNLGYSTDASSDYVGALSARLRSLCRGSLGMTLLCAADEETSDRNLFEGSTVVDLSAMGAPEKRALLMGILFMRLYEKRIAGGLPTTTELRHLMVLEEAHTLLKRTSTDQSQESSNPRGLAVEAFANALAEMRAYGQGFIIADQSASVLDDCVLRNTNTKIVMRAPFEEDRKVLGGALGLDDRQTQQLARLENQTAVVHQSNWLEPVLCRVHKDKSIPEPENIPSLGGEGRLRDKEALRGLVLAMWKERLSEISTVQEKTLSEEDLDAALSRLEINGIGAMSLKQSLLKGEYLTLDEISEHLPVLFPQITDTALSEITASVSTKVNHLHAMLERDVGIITPELNQAIVEDIAKSLGKMSMEEISNSIDDLGIRP